MFISEIRIPVNRLKGAGKTTETLLAGMGIRTVGDLLSFWPRTWEDRTEFHTLNQFESKPKIQVKCTVIAHDWIGFGRMRTLKLIIEDETGRRAALPCFNRPFLEKQFQEGTECVVYGSFYRKYGELQSSNFEIEPAGEDIPRARILPVYPLTEGLSQAKIRKLMQNAVSEYAKGINSELAEDIRREYKLPSKQDIIFFMHAPKNQEETEKARHAVIFEEFFFFEYALGKRSIERRGKLPCYGNGSSAAPRNVIPFTPVPLQEAVLRRLPFDLTQAQKNVISEINSNILSDNSPMARLLQGDVGSGKTLVAFFAVAAVTALKKQSALIVPTELLARQHAETAAAVLEPAGIRIAFLSGNIKSSGRELLLKELKQGNIDFIIGTHALFSKDVEYNNLSLVIVDEQHRFGVLQRAALIEKGRESSPEKTSPHLLMMSATPIPRTLALSVFGDLDVSTITASPPGRKPVITHLARKGNEKKVYDFVQKEISAGRQAYFVYPLISISESLALKSAEQMFSHLTERIFPGTNAALIHSKIPEEDQRTIMNKFKSGEIKILVATSVIEVGVDIPNATCMVIEQAERFGLAALHQLRGRVGRGKEQSYCFLIYNENLTEDGKARLKIMKETSDGFKIAEEDLKIRGPGEITGIMQSGYSSFKTGDPVRDSEILNEARTAAFNLLAKEHLPEDKRNQHLLLH